MRIYLATSGWDRPGTSMHTHARDILRACQTVTGIEASIYPVRSPQGARVGGVTLPWFNSHFRGYPGTRGGLVHYVGRRDARRGSDIATLHDLWEFRGRSFADYATRDQTRTLARDVARIVAVSPFTAREVTRFLPKYAPKVTYIPVPFESPELVGRPDPEYDVVWVGRNNPLKGVRNLFEAARRLPRIRFFVKWTPSGKAELDTWLRRTATALPNVQETSTRLSEAELYALFRSTRCVVSTALYEGFGAPFMEAYLRGTRLVLPRWAPYPDLYGDAAGVHWYGPERDGDWVAEELTRSRSFEVRGEDMVTSLADAILAATGAGGFVVDAELRRSVSYAEVGARLQAVYEEAQGSRASV